MYMPRILDCTLRDGSYALNFGFSAADTTGISSRLHANGIPYIEVGHGVGLGASNKGYGEAAETDLRYMRAARGNWGMFLIPGIGSMDDIRMAADEGMAFIRIGCDIADARDAGAYIDLARKKGLWVFSNLMKSYAVSAHLFRCAAKTCMDHGAQCIYIVDSAGGMLTHDIDVYASAIFHDRVFAGVDIGFHGHNNLGLANANAIHCATTGQFDVIDTTLCGIGRSGGNVSTEQFVAIAQRYRLFPELDVIELLHVSDDWIVGRFSDSEISSLDIAAGMAGFHSSYMPRILDAATEYSVDPLKLVCAVAAKDQVNCPVGLVEECAAALPRGSINIRGGLYSGDEQR